MDARPKPPMLAIASSVSAKPCIVVISPMESVPLPISATFSTPVLAALPLSNKSTVPLCAATTTGEKAMPSAGPRFVTVSRTSTALAAEAAIMIREKPVTANTFDTLFFILESSFTVARNLHRRHRRCH